MSELLRLIVAASRPFVPFSATVGGKEFAAFARKPSVADNQTLSEVWDQSYADARSKFDGSEASSAPIFAQLRRYTKEQLIKYIGDADKFDLRSEALQLHPGKPFDSVEVQEELSQLVDIKKEQYKALEQEDLLNIAMERRAHFYAMSKANEDLNYALASVMIFEAEGKPLFDSPSDASQLTQEVLTEIIDKASKALEEKMKVDPLESAPVNNVSESVTSSEKPTESIP